MLFNVIRFLVATSEARKADRYWPKGDNSPPAWMSVKPPIADMIMVRSNFPQ